MKNKVFVASLLLILIIILFFIYARPSLIGNIISNPPTIHQFYGNVNFEGNSDGILVEARYNGEVIVNTTSRNGTYGYNPLFVVQGVNDDSLIEFYLNSIKVTDYKFSNFGFTQLDLIYSISSPSNNAGSSGGSGGGEGSSFNNVSNKEPTSNAPFAVPKTENSNSEDNNNSQEKPTRYSGLSGFAVLNSSSGKAFAFGILTIIILIILIVFIIKTREKNK